MKALALRNQAARKWYNKIDIIYLILDKFVTNEMFIPKKNGLPIQIPQSDEAMLLDNIKKHRWIAWINITVAIFMYLYGLDLILNSSQFDVSIIVTGLLAPAMITGAAWFGVSFGGIPSNYIHSALLITSWMFLSFSLSMTLLIVILCAIVHFSIALFILIPIYLGLYIACIMYDNTDGLKIGLDETQLKYSRAMLNYHRKKGLINELETQKLYFNSDGISDLTREKGKDEYIMAISRRLIENAKGLENKQSTGVANDLIADSFSEIFRLDESKKWSMQKEVENFSNEAAFQDQEMVDNYSLKILLFIKEELSNISDIPEIDIDRLNDYIKKLRTLTKPIVNLKSDNQIDIHSEEEEKRKEEKQFLIDHQFAKIFNHIAKIIEQNKYTFMSYLPDEKFDGNN